jgi:GNAT superfamily N-acetyltransferase
MKKRAQSVQIEVYRGSEIHPHIDEFAALRLSTFREYPYLYEGDIENERNYLKLYSGSQNSLLLLAKDGGKVIGAISGIPLKETSKVYWGVFSENSISLDDIYYLGELILLKEYRSGGIGTRLYDHFEKLIREKKIYTTIAFAELAESGDDPQKPEDYISLEEFWGKRGFVKHPELAASFSWKQTGKDQKTRHALVFSTKMLK